MALEVRICISFECHVSFNMPVLSSGGCSGLSLVGVAVAGHSRSVELPLLAFASSSFSFGLVVLFTPAIMYRYWLL